jgi:hypothetical protein
MYLALGGRASPDANAVHVLFEVPRPVKARSSATEYGVLVGKTKHPRIMSDIERRIQGPASAVIASGI